MVRLCHIIVLLLALASPARSADPDPLRFSHTLTVEGRQIEVPMELYLTPTTDTEVSVKLAGNLRTLQRHLPALLTDVVQDDCRMRVAVQTEEAVAEGDGVRARGRGQVQLYYCNAAEDLASRRRYFGNITTVDLLLDGGIRDDCLEAELEELTLDPSGLAGAVLNLTGLTRRIQSAVQADLNEILNEDENCLDLPEGLQLLNTRIDRGGFRNFGDGALGFVLQGRVDVTAPNTIALLGLLHERGALDQQDACRVANPCPAE